jgi:hypothetical protein
MPRASGLYTLNYSKQLSMCISLFTWFWYNICMRILYDEFNCIIEYLSTLTQNSLYIAVRIIHNSNSFKEWTVGPSLEQVVFTHTLYYLDS